MKRQTFKIQFLLVCNNYRYGSPKTRADLSKHVSYSTRHLKLYNTSGMGAFIAIGHPNFTDKSACHFTLFDEFICHFFRSDGFNFEIVFLE